VCLHRICRIDFCFSLDLLKFFALNIFLAAILFTVHRGFQLLSVSGLIHDLTVFLRNGVVELLQALSMGMDIACVSGNEVVMLGGSHQLLGE